MRLLAATLATAALLLTGLPPSVGATAPGGCRQQWVDLHQRHVAHGNPQGSGVTSQLQRRWDSRNEKAGRMAQVATRGNCGHIRSFARTWRGLERLMSGMHRHDYLFRLRIANGALRHYRDKTGDNPGRQVMRAFRFLRQQAPQANGDLAPVFAAATAVGTMQRTQVTGYLRDFRAAARTSEHAMKAKAWVQIIEHAKLGHL